jgi:16S rRNA (cytidine1402-2'-O)-methyltransferase
MSEERPGILYIVSTPIGNLKDITLRAIDILSQVNLVAAEDTRRTQILLAHYQIHTPTTSYHDHNKERKTPQIIARLKANESVALVSDAGTPGISDPCFYLIREAIRESITVTTVPGATAFVSALILSGLPLHRFVFEGFLPTKKGRQTRLLELGEERRTFILYESPHRLIRTLTDIREIMGDREVALVKELTKIHENTIRGSISRVLQELELVSTKGEWVLVVQGKTSAAELV